MAQPRVIFRDGWHDRTVVVIGAARQGIALARYLARQGARVILNDQRSLAELETVKSGLEAHLPEVNHPVRWVADGHPLDILVGAQLVCVSGGVPLTLPIISAAREQGIPLTNDSQIFLETAPCPVIGITGSAGKTTTTTLVGRMAQAAAGQPGQPRRVFVGGNIGNPLLDALDEMTSADLAIMELSSFQLELMVRSPQIAAVLNITPNHLDRHGSMAAYSAAKARILSGQVNTDLAILNREDPGSWRLMTEVRGRLSSFGWDAPSAVPGTYLDGGAICHRSNGNTLFIMPAEAIELRGEHNRLNVLAACAIGLGAGLPVEALRKGVDGFRGVHHRLEYVREWGGAAWYNDSIATAPERTLAAIRSFSEPLVLLLGGRDKDLSWDALALEICRRGDQVVVFGEAAGKIVQALTRAGCTASRWARVAGLNAAVQAAAERVRPGMVVLLSPGGTSYDEFRDFEERGEWYRELVTAL